MEAEMQGDIRPASWLAEPMCTEDWDNIYAYRWFHLTNTGVFSNNDGEAWFFHPFECKSTQHHGQTFAKRHWSTVSRLHAVID